MWTAFTTVTLISLASVAAEPLTLSNARVTHGILGVPRTNTQFLPGDSLTLAFDIEGIQADRDGKALYSMAMEIVDRQGKVLFKQVPRDQETHCSLGGNYLPAYANVQIGLDQPPGEYTVRVTVTDRASKATGNLAFPYQVLPKQFGMVRLTTTSDPDGHFPAALHLEGQSLWVNFATVGFERDRTNGQPNLTVSMRVLDDTGRPTLTKPYEGVVNQNIPAQALSLPMQFMIDLNRAGRYTVELTAADKTTGKKATLSFPLTVLKPR